MKPIENYLWKSRDEIRDQIYFKTRISIRKHCALVKIRDQIWDQISGEVYRSVVAQVRNPVWRNIE